MNKRFYLPYLLTLSLISACLSDNLDKESADTEYRQEMRLFVQNISAYAKSINPNFLVIPQNGQELVTDTGEPDGIPNLDYLEAIDAVGREDLFYGYKGDNRPTPDRETQYMLSLCMICEQNGVEVLTTDYCSSKSKMLKSYQLNEQQGFISFAADHRNLDNIPSYPNSAYNENANDIDNIAQAKNFLYLLNFEEFDTKQALISSVSDTNYDVIIMDLFFNNDSFTDEEIERLKTKKNGAKRLVVAYMSIGEAEDYRYYWQSHWRVGEPSWLKAENPDWKGNYKVEYWQADWQNIIYGTDNSYLKKVLDASFDGIYLDIIDAFDYFER